MIDINELGTDNQWGLSEQQKIELGLLYKEFRLAEIYSYLEFFFHVLIVLLIVSFIICGVIEIYFLYKKPYDDTEGIFFHVKKIKFSNIFTGVMGLAGYLYCVIEFSPFDTFNPVPGCQESGKNIRTIDGMFIATQSNSRDSSVYINTYIYDNITSSIIKVTDIPYPRILKVKYLQEKYIGMPVKATYHSRPLGMFFSIPDFFYRNYIITLEMNGQVISSCDDYEALTLERKNHKSSEGFVFYRYFYFVVYGLALMFMVLLARRELRKIYNQED